MNNDISASLKKSKVTIISLMSHIENTKENRPTRKRKKQGSAPQI